MPSTLKCGAVLVVERALTAILSDEPTVSVKAIKTIADGIWMRPVRPSQPEHDLLAELMLRMKGARRGRPQSLIRRGRDLSDCCWK